ncbi:unnamed protein product [Periconia digitata]|uniref:Uncharacterized protein n=1 Tax=Periconia digitata TaxID=1303443 RepID=A0A9W4XWY6_9PLEO|nr:unnamed protein product [Periconia digitata]
MHEPFGVDQPRKVFLYFISTLCNWVILKLCTHGMARLEHDNSIPVELSMKFVSDASCTYTSVHGGLFKVSLTFVFSNTFCGLTNVGIPSIVAVIPGSAVRARSFWR